MDVNKLNPDYSSRDLEQNSDLTPDLYLDEEQEVATLSSNRYKFMVMGAAGLLGIQLLVAGAIYVLYGSPQLSIESNEYDALDIKTVNTLQEAPAVKGGDTGLAEIENAPFSDNDSSNINIAKNIHTEANELQVEPVSAEVSNGEEVGPLQVEAELTELVSEPDQDVMVDLVSEAFSYERKLSGMTIEQQESPEHEGRDHNEWFESDAVLTSLSELGSELGGEKEEFPVGITSAEERQFAAHASEAVEVAEISDSQYDSYSKQDGGASVAAGEVHSASVMRAEQDEIPQLVNIDRIERTVGDVTEDTVSGADNSEGMKDSTPQWVLKVAAFKKSKNALTLQAELQKQGIETYIETVVSENGELFRIYAGPSDSDFEAVKAMIKKEYGIVSGKVSPYKG